MGEREAWEKGRKGGMGEREKGRHERYGKKGRKVERKKGGKVQSEKGRYGKKGRKGERENRVDETTTSHHRQIAGR